MKNESELKFEAEKNILETKIYHFEKKIVELQNKIEFFQKENAANSDLICQLKSENSKIKNGALEMRNSFEIDSNEFDKYKKSFMV